MEPYALHQLSVVLTSQLLNILDLSDGAGVRGLFQLHLGADGRPGVQGRHREGARDTTGAGTLF